MKKTIALFLTLTLLFFSSCSNYQKLLKSTDMEAKYNAAVKYYEKKDYYHALQLFEELTSVFKGTSRAEQSYYYFAYCTYYVDDYAMAAYHFNSFTQSYPNSKYAEEMQYMYAFCFYQDSPIYSLDQNSTLEAIEKFQLFINKFPKSNRVDEANLKIDELRLKLENKEYNNAKLYYLTENYKAAVFAFDNLLKDYPASNFKEESMFLALKSSYLYATNSVDAKKRERFQTCLDRYYNLLDNFPQSRYLRDSEKIYDKVKAELNLTAVQGIKKSN